MNIPYYDIMNIPCYDTMANCRWRDLPYDGSVASVWSRVFVYGSPKSATKAGALTGSDASTTCLACHAALTAKRHAQNCDIRFQ